jgi:dynactin-4
MTSSTKESLAPPDTNQPVGPFFLSCPYCEWSSLEAGIQFNKPTKITEQLLAMRQGDRSTSPSSTRSTRPTLATTDELSSTQVSSSRSIHDRFATLVRFYKHQLADSSAAAPQEYTDNTNYNSPRSLERIMNMYSATSHSALKKSREKPQPMREALDTPEGLELTSQTAHAEAEAIEKLQTQGYEATTSSSQRASHPFNHHVRFIDRLWPTATLLRTRRSKRCRTCRHIIARPEPKMGSTRYKIRLLAQNNIPRLSLRLLAPTASSAPASAFALTPAALSAQQNSEYERLNPGLPVQFLLTLTNPLFEAVRVSLATPVTTPGHVASRVTVLCPTFTIGAASDMWDPDAISSGGGGGSSSSTTSKDQSSTEDKQPEAGKVWEKGRNWTTVVVEVIPGRLDNKMSSSSPTTATHTSGEGEDGAGGEVKAEDDNNDKGVDDDILEIPVFVRVEWETEVTAEDAAATGATKGAKVSREIAFWSVLGAGKIVGL